MPKPAVKSVLLETTKTADHLMFVDNNTFHQKHDSQKVLI